MKRVGVLVVGAIVALGCAVGTGGPGGSREPRTAPPAPATTRSIDPDEFAKDIDGAVSIAEAYWKGRIRGFTPIRRVVEYTRDGELTCGGQPIPRSNAVYCSAGDFIAYDVNWATGAFRQIGDAFLFFLLGHEYAHGVQVRLGIEHEYTIDAELEADCMAGAYIGDSIKSGALVLEEGDLDELRSGLLAVGDPEGQPWFEQDSHGTAQQRTDSFFRGYEQSLDACGLE